MKSWNAAELASKPPAIVPLQWSHDDEVVECFPVGLLSRPPAFASMEPRR